MNKEIWKDVKGYEGYYKVSNLGNVKAIERQIVNINGVKQLRKGHDMSKYCNGDGYLTVKLTKNNKDKRYFIHRLVAEAFISDKPVGCERYEINHKDCNRKNNNVENLEWCTHTENVRHSAKLGNYSGRFGELNPNYKNTTLKERFANNPELRKTQARPNAQNGRAVKINMYGFNDKFIKTFFGMGECAEYLQKEKGINCSINYLRNKISECSKNKRSLYGFRFERV